MTGPLPGYAPLAWWPRGWPGELLRIAAFMVVMTGLAIMFGSAWAFLPAPTPDGWLLAGAAVTAAAAIMAGTVMIRLVDARPAAALGIGISRRTLPHVALGGAIGAAGLVAAVLAIAAAGAIAWERQPGSAGAWLAAVAGQGAIFAVAALAEEALFRGYAFQVLVRWAGPVFATSLGAALFAAAHGANPEVGVLALLNIFLAGVLLGIAYLRTLSLWFATALHMTWNWCMAALFDLPVSGITIFDTPLYDADVGGPAWWTGGAFGPEGGLVGTIGFGLALLLVLRMRAVAADETIAAARPIVLDRARFAGTAGWERS